MWLYSEPGWVQIRDTAPRSTERAQLRRDTPRRSPPAIRRTPCAAAMERACRAHLSRMTPGLLPICGASRPREACSHQSCSIELRSALHFGAIARKDPASQTSHEDQDQNHDEDHAENTGGPVTPRAAV